MVNIINISVKGFLEPLLLALVLVELQNTCKKKLNRKMLERPNICYIFEKLRVQECQIWHSHVSIPSRSAPAHSTRPHNAKKALYVIISAEIPENLVHKSCCIKVIFHDAAIFFSSPCQVVPGACLSQIVTNSHTSNTHKHPQNAHKHPQRVVLPHFRERVDESPRQDENFGTFGLFLAFFVTELRPFKAKSNLSNVFLIHCSLIPLMHCS